MESWERDAALAWVQSHWTNRHDCPICGSDDWGIGDTLALRPYGQEGTYKALLNPQVVPLIQVLCKVCGYTALVNGVVAGLYARSGEAGDV